MQKIRNQKQIFFVQSSDCTHTKYLVSISYTKKKNQAYGIRMQNDS